MSDAVPVDVGSQVPLTPYGGPEALLRLGRIQLDGTVARCSMGTGPWLVGEGGLPAAGALGVLLDDVLGQAVIAHAPPAHWAVTTELAMDFAAPLPTDGSPLTAVADAVAADAVGGLSRGLVRDAAGRPVAAGSTWARFFPGVPAAVAQAAPAAPDATSLPALADVLRPGAEGLVLPAHPGLGNPTGVAHGGLVAFAAEQAARQVLGSGRLATASLRVAYLRPSMPPVTFAAAVLHAGRSLALVEVFATGVDGRRCAAATVGFRAAH